MFNPDYKEMLSILNDQQVDYVIVGAYALAVHGLPRATGDMDILLRPDRDNSERVYRSLAIFGAPLENLRPEDFAREGVIFQIGVAPCRIDFLTKIDGVSFTEARNGAVEIPIEDLRVPFLGLVELKKNKLSTGRTKDRLDVELLNELE